MVFTNIQSSDAEYASKIRKEQEDCSRIRDGLSRNKLENTVVSVAQFASRDFSNAQNQFTGTLATSFSDERSKPKPVAPKSDQTKKQKFRLSSFHKMNQSNCQAEQMFDQLLGDQNQNNGGNSTAPQTPSDSPATGPTGAKTEPKDDEPLSPVSDSPPSPKFVEEKVEIWSGLKLPVDETGKNLKTDACRPVLTLDGALEQETFYPKPDGEATLVFDEFLPRKRLKRNHINEKSDPIGIKQLPIGFEPTREELNGPKLPDLKSEPGGPTGRSEQFSDIYDSADNPRISLKSEIKTDPEMMTCPDDYGILTPETPGDESGDTNIIQRYRPIRNPDKKVPPPNIGDPNLQTSTLTPPTPKPSDWADRTEDALDHDFDSRPRKGHSRVRAPADESNNGVYASYKIEPKYGIPSLDNFDVRSIERIESYKPSWTPGSNSFKIREERKLKEQQRRQQNNMMSKMTAERDQSSGRKSSIRQPHTPGSSAGGHGGPKTPGMAPGTPGGQIAPPGTPGGPTTPGYPGNPRTPGGGPGSVGPLTPFASAHTPGGRQPHTPGASRSPGHAGIAPSPASGRDFSAPKTPRTPRTPGSVRTPGKASNSFNGGFIRGVSSLQEVSALLLSLVLSDSVLDAHRDRNFIQAPLCVCRNDVVGTDGHLLGLQSKSEDDDECSCGFSAIASRSSAVGPWGGILLEDEVNLVGTDIENEAFAFRNKDTLPECLRTTPEVRSKNGISEIGKPNLQSAAELLSDLVKKAGLVRSLNITPIKNYVSFRNPKSIRLIIGLRIFMILILRCFMTR